MRLFIFAVLLISTSIKLMGQDSTQLIYRLHYAPSIGLNFPITKLLKGAYTDILVGYRDVSVYCSQYSGSLFLNEKWGIGFRAQLGFGWRGNTRKSNFENAIQSKFGTDFFINRDHDQLKSNSADIKSSSNSFLIGIVHKMEKGHFIFMPKILFGLTHFNNDNTIIYLEDKISNLVYRLSFDTKQTYNTWDGRTLALSFSSGYHLTKRILVNMDITYNYFSTQFEIHEKVRNLFDGTQTTEVIKYHARLHSIGIGLGFSIKLLKTKTFKNS